VIGVVRTAGYFIKVAVVGYFDFMSVKIVFRLKIAQEKGFIKVVGLPFWVDFVQ